MKIFFLTVVCLMTIKVSAQENPNIFKYMVGTVEVWLLSEGQGVGRSGILIGATPEMLQECLPEGTFPNSCNAFLLRFPSGKNVLIDAGRSSVPLLENLKSVGVSPQDINTVLITHIHGDHIGGLLSDGQAVFTNAKVYLSQQERGHGQSNAGARNVMEAYSSNLSLFEPNEIDKQPQELFAGVRAVAAFGHTPGHTLFLLESGSEKLLFWGDLTHALAVQMPYPHVAVTFDVDAEKAVETRKKVLQFVAANKIAVAGSHNAFPGIGTLNQAANSGYIYKSVTE